MKTYSLYDHTTGLFVGRTFSTNEADATCHATAVKANVPDGHGLIEGTHDHLSRKVDIAQVAPLRAAHAEAHAASMANMRAAHAARSDDPTKGEFREPAEPPFITPPHVVVDHQPPAPSDDHEWDADTRRWQLNKEVQADQQARAAARAEIARLEHEEQPGVLRDVALGKPGAVDRLRALDERIAALRGQQLSHCVGQFLRSTR